MIWSFALVAVLGFLFALTLSSKIVIFFSIFILIVKPWMSIAAGSGAVWAFVQAMLLIGVLQMSYLIFSWLVVSLMSDAAEK